LTRKQKKDRLNWCLANIDNDFENWVFVDETSVWINEVPLYHHRHSDSHPDPAGFSSGLKVKINVWGAISSRGSSNFTVHLIFTNKKIIQKVSLFSYYFILSCLQIT
jgi:hypothetical protein